MLYILLFPIASMISYIIGGVMLDLASDFYDRFILQSKPLNSLQDPERQNQIRLLMWASTASLSGKSNINYPDKDGNEE